MSATPYSMTPRRRMAEGFRFLSVRTGLIGAIVLVIVVAIALLGPFFAPHSIEKPIGVPYAGPSSEALLGTDGLGRDVLSRVLWGGRSVLWLGGLSVLLAYVVGAAIGLLAGFKRGLLDNLLMRSADVLLAFPALLFILVLVTGAGSSKLVLVLGVGIIQIPMVARVVRSAALEQSVRGFVDAAVARGDSTFQILRREILPGLIAPISVDFALHFTYSIILIASVNFLSLGLQPPAADWGLMVSENREGITLNPWVIIAPAILIAALTISISLVGDAIARTLGRSDLEGVS
jgi:peptide/nickel transport system permease protein